MPASFASVAEPQGGPVTGARMQDRYAEIQWQTGGVPVARRFDDPYFSLQDGLAESRHVFLAGNGLPGRFRDGFHIAELGFGAGLNFLATVRAWRAAGVPGRLHYTGFEAFPMRPADLARTLAAFPELDDLAAELAALWPVAGAVDFGADVALTVIAGDARQTLPGWAGRADAWFLDGFAPAKNPELWQADLLAEVAAHTSSGGTAATYSAAGFVRRGLRAAGFVVERLPGYARKRHMTRASLS